MQIILQFLTVFWKPTLAVIALVLAFGMGFKSSSNYHEVKTLKLVAEAYEQQRSSLDKAYRKIVSLQEEQANLSAQTKIIIKEVPVYVTEQMDKDCTTDPAVISLLDAARSNAMPDAAKRAFERDTSPSTFGYRDLIRAEIETAAQYNATRLQCNALISWVKSNY